MSRARRSVRTRLVVLLLAGLALVWIATAVATVLEANHEVEEVFDAHLAQNATLLVMRIGEETDEIDTEHAPVPHKYAKALSFQVWKRGRKLMLHSADAPDTPFSAQPEGFSTVTLDGRDWRVFGLWDAKREFLVQVRDAVRDRRHVMVDIVKAFAAPFAIAVPLIALLVWFAVGRAFRPLDRVSAELLRRDPAYLAPIEADAPAEIAPLVERLNALLGRVQASLEGERRFTSDAAHELRTPLAALRAQLEVAQGAATPAERDQAIVKALAAGERSTHVVEQLLTLARLEHGAWQAIAAPFDLRSIAASAIAEAAPRAVAKGVDLALEGEAGTAVKGHEGLAAIAVGNLLDNAIRHSPPGTEIVVNVARHAGRARLVVRDHGPGIPPSRREEALRRFARLEGAEGEGSGLGLSIVSRIAELHDAPFALGTPAEGPGLEASIDFPAA